MSETYECPKCRSQNFGKETNVDYDDYSIIYYYQCPKCNTKFSIVFTFESKEIGQGE